MPVVLQYSAALPLAITELGENYMNKRIAVLGIGAVGGTIAAWLTKGGYDVTLIDQWATHVDKMRSDGLKLSDANGEFTVPVKAFHLNEVSNFREQFDIVFLSVKSFDTEWSTYLIKPHLKSTGFIVSAQNALNDEVVAGVVGFNRTVGCVVYIAAGMYEPGHVTRTDPLTGTSFVVGELSGLVTNRVKEVVEALQLAGGTEATTNIWGARWSKLVLNCMTNSLAGIIGPETSSLNEEQKDTAHFIRVVAGSEGVRVANALGIEIEPISSIPAEGFTKAVSPADFLALKNKWAEAMNKRSLAIQSMKKISAPDRPSLLQDLMKGRRTEIDFLNGHVVNKGAEAGIPTSMNRAIVDIIKAIEEGKRNSSKDNLELLKPHLIT
jgi:2-dehydropantoate 2-reductase